MRSEFNGVTGIIGFVDDYRKVIRKDPKGLIARWKYFWQSVVAILVAFYLYSTASIEAETALLVPFFKEVMPQVNDMLARNNEDMMFVTIFAGFT